MGLKDLSRPNTLAYLSGASVAKKKSFMALIKGLDVGQHRQNLRQKIDKEKEKENRTLKILTKFF
jgi:hypothetical protein